MLSIAENQIHNYFGILRLQKQLEMYSDALKHYESAYTSFKNHPDFLEEYGYFLLEEGMRKEAKRSIYSVNTTRPDTNSY